MILGLGVEAKVTATGVIGEAAMGTGRKWLDLMTKEEVPMTTAEKNTGSQADLFIGVFYNLKRSLKMRVIIKTDPNGKATLA